MRAKKTFNTTDISKEDQRLLESFYERRAFINGFLMKNQLDLMTCPGCGFPTYTEDWFHEICSVCNWQHDGHDDPHADEIWGGPNYQLSLTENRINICRTLKEKSRQLGGKIIEEPTKIIDRLNEHQLRMDAFKDDDLMDALRSDPIWQEWEVSSKEILSDLIKNI